MKKLHFFLILFLIPSLVYGLNQKECNKIQDQAIAEWNRHIELFQEFNSFGADQDGHGLHRLRESLYCCQRALSLIDTILNDIAGKSKKKRNEPWRVTMKEACEKHKKNINDEITQLQKGINNVLSSMAFDKAKNLYDESLKIADEARNKHKECPTRTLSNVDAVVSGLQEVANLYRSAESLAKEAYTTLTAAPSCDEASKTALGQTVENFKQAAISIEKEAAEWPEKALAQKVSLKERLETLTEDSTLFEEKGLSRSSYELRKQALPILETLVQNSEGDEKEVFEKRLEGLKTSIALFEETADQNRLTQAIAPLSEQEFKSQEEARRESFFKSDFALDPSLFFKTFIYPTSRPSVIPLDGQIGKSQKEYTLYLDQFYRFYLQSDDAVSKLIVKVYKQGDLVHEEEVSLPVKNTHSWRSYLLDGGLIIIPETKLEKEFGLDLRLKITCDPRCLTSLILMQKASDPSFQFSFALEDGTSLYTCDFLGPPPWQLDTLRKPSMRTANRLSCNNNYSFDCDSKVLPNMQLGERFSLLDEFVETHRKDPLALAAYVQNEISLVDYYCYQEEGVFQAPGIQRNALRVYLEGQGSAWEQCQLLIYLLRKAGYRAFYAIGKEPHSLPKEYIQNMLFTRLPEGQEEGLVEYPWVVFFDGEKWVSLFPWMKEIQINEGFDLYQFLPEEFASADRWILHYLKGDERILKHIGSDGDESAGRLFVAFVEEHLRKQGLSLDDVGIHRTQIKRQFSSFADFPSPKINGPFNIIDLSGESPLFAKADIEIFSRENPDKKLHARIPLTSIISEAIPLRFKEDRLYVHFIGEEKEQYLELNASDRSIAIKVTPQLVVGTKIVSATGSLALEKGGNAVLCFHFGGKTPKITSLNFEQFNREKEEAKRLELLLSFLGAAYFEKCGVAQELLARLHKIHPTLDFAFGLAKLIERGGNESKEKLPQVDMISLNRPLPAQEGFTFWQQEIFSALRQFKTLSIVDSSSNEHQILRDIFSDTSAISTVKLLQLSYRYQCKEEHVKEGFLALNTEILKEVEESPETAQSLYFSHLKDLNLRELQTSAQWTAAKISLGQEGPFSPYAYAYMTPGLIYSPDGTYKEMGTFIFHPERGSALISSGSIVLNGGLGSPLPDYYFYPSVIPEWQLTPNYNGYMNTYKFEIPSRLDTSIPSLPQTVPLEKTRWEPDVRIEHKSPKGFVADPVDVITGSFYIDETDLALPGPFPLEIRRNYNSQNPLMGQLGAGWKLSLNPFLVNQDGKLYAAESDGTIICYDYNSETSRWEVFPEDNPDLCNFNQKGIGSAASPFHAYIEDDVLYGADGSKRFFEDGLLRKWVNAKGISLTFSYRDDRLIRIESSYGEFLRFEYNETGKISEIYAKDGRRISYSYSSQGNLVKVTLPNTASITYEYDHAHRMIRETKPHGKVLENKYEDGKVKEQYSPMGPQQQMIISATFDYQDGVTTVTDAKEGTTIYKIFQKQIYKIVDPLGAVTLQSWFIDEESWFDAQVESIQPWNEAGAARRSLKSTTDKRGLTTSYLYDEKGNPIQISLQGDDLTGDGQTTVVKKLKFNDHNLCTQEEVLEQKTITTFDKTFPYLPKRVEKYSSNHLLSYIDLEYNAQGLLEKENNNGAITRWEYDARGFPIQKTEETGTENPDVVTEYSYNAQGQCIKVVMEDGSETNVYDIMGNLIEAHRFSSIDQPLSSSYMGYNLNSQPIWQQTTNAQNTTYFDYHSSGQIKAKRQQLAPSQKVAYTLFEYDPRGYLIEEVDPLGYTTYREHDALGNVLSETKEGHTTEFTYEPGGFVETITSPSGAKTTRRYTTNGLLKEEIYSDGTKASIIYDLFSRPILETKNGITWEIHYDDINAQVTRKHTDTGEMEVRKYDARGNLISFTDRAGHIFEKTYDSLNRLKTEKTPSGEETTYDYAFNMVICNLPNGETTTTTYEGGRIKDYVVHDAKNQELSSGFYIYDAEGDIQKSVQGNSQITLTWMNGFEKPIKVQKGNILETFEYDASGNCTAMTDGEGLQIRQTFDGLGRLIQKELPDGGLLKFDYDLDSNLTKVQFPNGNIWKASYDCMGRKISEKLYSGRESTQNWEYTYEKGLLRATKDPMGRMREYEYDSHNRLVQESIDGWQRAYAYDPKGLLLSAEQIGSQSISWVSSWFYSPREEHSEVKRSYDEDGHLTYESISLNSELIQETHQGWEPGMRQLRIGNHERTFVYQNNRLAEVASGNTYLTYAYDRSGQLKSKTTPLTSKLLHYNFAGLPEVVQMQLPIGNLQENLEWNPSGKLSVYSSPSTQKQFTYTPRGYLQTAGAERYEFDFRNTGTGIRTAAPNWQVPQNGLDAFGRVIAEIMDKFSWRMSYDSMGQVISQGQRQFEWDPWGRLLKVTDPSFTWEASYDAFGRRLQTRHTPVNSFCITTTSFFDPEEEFQEIGVQLGDKTYWKLYGPDSCDAVIDETGDSVYLMHNTLNELIAIVSERDSKYTPRICSSYGPQTEATISSGSDLLSYAGSLSWHSNSLDPTGLILMGKRYYDPKAGRFISPDPIGHPICMDLYAYAGGDPVNYFDPDGRFQSHVYQPIKATVLNIWNNPRFQGGVQAFGGFLEASAGAALAPTPFAPIGLVMLGHGADHFAAGGYAMVTGKYRATGTEMLLQKTGMSPEWASFSNNLFSVCGFTGSIGLARNFAYQSSRAISQAAMSSFEVSVSSFEGLQTGKNFKPFTRNYYRENLKIFTDAYPSKNIHAHHVFPQEFEEMFLQRGMNIHHPKHLTWWEGKAHQSAASGYNAEWQSFFEANQGAAKTQILEEGKRIMNLYGIETNY